MRLHRIAQTAAAALALAAATGCAHVFRPPDGETSYLQSKVASASIERAVRELALLGELRGRKVDVEASDVAGRADGYLRAAVVDRLLAKDAVPSAPADADARVVVRAAAAGAEWHRSTNFLFEVLLALFYQSQRYDGYAKLDAFAYDLPQGRRLGMGLGEGEATYRQFWLILGLVGPFTWDDTEYEDEAP